MIGSFFGVPSKTYLGIWLAHTGFGLPFAIYLLRSYMAGLPRELMESARIDGASDFEIFLKIVLPLSMPAMSTLAALTILTSWNDFLWPLIVITNTDQMTVPLGLSYFQGAHQTNWPLLMAGNVMSLVPMLIVFVLAQRYFVQSVAGTGLKG